jgi:hypothetical protein
VFYNAGLTSLGVGIRIFTAGYIGGPKAIVAVAALSAYLYPFIYLGDLKL